MLSVSLIAAIFVLTAVVIKTRIPNVQVKKAFERHLYLKGVCLPRQQSRCAGLLFVGVCLVRGTVKGSSAIW